MRRHFALAFTSVAFLGAALIAPMHALVQAQPAKGAAAAFERVREVMNSRFSNLRLPGDPDQDFAALLIAHHEDLIFLAKTHLEYGADRDLRQLSEKLLEDQQKQIDQVKQWQVRNRQPGYQAQPNQSPAGTGPLNDWKGDTSPAQTAQVQPPAPPLPVAQLPLVSGTVQKVDRAQGRLTIDHGPIPNLNMDSMTMVFRARDPDLLKQVKPGDKIQFTADRVNGQITVTRIQKR
jgi:Cu/Ag efflux protein CusF